MQTTTLTPTRAKAEEVDPVELMRGYRRWWGSIGSRYATSTARTYRGIVSRAFAEIPLDQITDPTKVKPWLDEKRTKHAELARAALRDFYGSLMRDGILAHDPLTDIKVHRRSGRRIRRALEPDELVRLVVAAVYIGVGKTRWTGQQVAWAILAQYGAGLRPGELIGMHLDDLRLNGSSSSVYITNTKTGNDRIVPLNGVAREAFAQLSAGRRGLLMPFGRTQYWSHFRRAALLAGIDPERARPYALRHSFATHLIERGVHQRFVADLLGHVDMRHVMGYTVPSHDVLRAAVGTLDGRPGEAVGSA